MASISRNVLAKTTRIYPPSQHDQVVLQTEKPKTIAKPKSCTKLKNIVNKFKDKMSRIAKKAKRLAKKMIPIFCILPDESFTTTDSEDSFEDQELTSAEVLNFTSHSFHKSTPIPIRKTSIHKAKIPKLISDVKAQRYNLAPSQRTKRVHFN